MSLESSSTETDVLIVGAGPTGLMAALWMSHLGIRTRFIDKRSTRVSNGHADGLQPRTMEIFDTFGFAKNIIQHSASFMGFCSWAADEEGKTHRTGRSSAAWGGGSRFVQQTLHQGHIERIMLDAIGNRSELKVERGVIPLSLKFDKAQAEDPDAFPITVELKHLSEDEFEPDQVKSHSLNRNGDRLENDPFKPASGRGHTNVGYESSGKEGTTEIVRAKYMLGSEGAHSWTRRQLGFKMEGESTDIVWGVMDIIPITDFPDIRKLVTIQSAEGTLIIIPRESKLVRIYVQLLEVEAGSVAKDNWGTNPEKILHRARKIMAPYTIRYTYCDWWTAYQAGQRVSNRYTESERIFLAGDAVHTHTPLGGQGMNVSMQDAFNLGWKLGGVIKGQLPRSILKSYEGERRPIAQHLIAFDHKLTRISAGKPNKDELRQLYEEQRLFLSGVGIQYEPSTLIAQSEQPYKNGFISNSEGQFVIAKTSLAKNITLGMRLQSVEITCQANSCPWQINSLLKSDGSFRLLVFAGDISQKLQMNRISTLGSYLALSLLNRYINSPIKILLIHSADTEDVELSDFHSTFFPLDEDFGYDYGIVYTDTTASGGEGRAHDFYGVDPKEGCVVVTRPDQYVGYVGALEDGDGLRRYFDGVLVKK